MFKKSLFKILIVSFVMAMSINIYAEEPTIEATSAILMDAETGQVLYEKNGYDKAYPASMTKVVTALVFVDYFEPGEEIVIGPEVNEVPEGSSLANIDEGDILLAEDLLRALIIPSGNEAAMVIAVNVAERATGQTDLTYAEAEPIFADLMNQKAIELGAVNSNFTNPHGLHDDNHYTTPYDMALLSKAYLENPLLNEIASEQYYKVEGVPNIYDSTTRAYTWTSKNELIVSDSEYYNEYATGIKTGHTGEAGYCLTASAKKDEQTLIAVVFNSSEMGRFADANALFEYGFNEFTYQVIQAPNEVSTEISINNGTKDDITMPVYSDTEVALYMTDEDMATMETNIYIDPQYTDPENETKLMAPIEKDTKVGQIEYVIDGVSYTSDIYASETIDKSGIIARIISFIKTIPDKIFTKEAIPYWIIGGILLVIVGFFGYRFYSNTKNRYKNKYRF